MTLGYPGPRLLKEPKLFRDLHDDISNYSSDPEKYLDVPFVPTDENVVEAMLNLGNIGPKDIVYDLGSGDGRILIAAAKDRDARGIGIDIDPMRIADAMEFAGWAHVEYLVDFIEDDIFTADFSKATVVTLYLLQSINVQLRPRLLSELRPGTRIISHAFDMGDWEADEWLTLSGIKIYKWIIPAQIAGVWEWQSDDGTPYRIELDQKYQDVTGSAWAADKQVLLQSAKLVGGCLELGILDEEANSLKSFTLNFENSQLKSVVSSN